MHTLISEFCADWVQWVEDGCPTSIFFRTDEALCMCYLNWCIYYKVLVQKGNEISMQDLFKQEYLDKSYPFDLNSIEYHSVKDFTKNPKRLAWAKAHAVKRNPCTHDYEPLDGAFVCVNCNHYIKE